VKYGEVYKRERMWMQMNHEYTGNIFGFKIVGQSGGANANFMRVDFKDPKTGDIYNLYTDARGLLSLVKSKTGHVSKQEALTDDYDVNGAIIATGDEFEKGRYRKIYLQNPKNPNEAFVVTGTGTHIKIYPFGEKRESYRKIYMRPDDYEEIIAENGRIDRDRKKKTTSTKSKRPLSKKSGVKLQSFYGVKTNVGKKAESMLTSIYRKKKTATNPKRKITKRSDKK
jgi:hypothetical protein